MLLADAATLRRHPFITASCFKGLPFCDQKGSEKVSLLRGSEPRLRGYSPLRTPKLWSKAPKAKKCRNDCIFLNAFGPFSILTPSGPKFSING